MNWDALGAIGEIVGAIGVIVTLGYLATQIRANSMATRLESADRILARTNTSQGRLISDPVLADIVRRGGRDLSELDPADRMRVRLWFFELLRNSEQATMYEDLGVLDAGLFERWRDSLHALIDRWPELSRYLRENEQLFDPAFVGMFLEPGPERAAPSGAEAAPTA